VSSKISCGYGSQLTNDQTGGGVAGRLCDQADGIGWGRPTGEDTGGVQVAGGGDFDAAVGGGGFDADIGEAVNQNIPCLAGVCCDVGCASAAADAQQCGGGDDGGVEVSAGAVAEISGGSLQGDGVAGD
jgi:hypothetical protein